MDFLDNTNSLLVKCKEIDIINHSDSILIHSPKSKWEEPDYKDYQSKLKKALTKKFTFKKDLSDFELENVLLKYKNIINNN
jgi:hypothetical protein